MKEINEIFKAPGYFYCEKTRCKLRIEICISRQKANEVRESSKYIPFPICEKCEQGAENRSLEKPNKGMAGNPKRGKNKRNESCALYADCLEIAAKKDWKSFNCESCSNYGDGDKAMTEEKKNIRICEDCGEKTTLSANCPFCPSCMAKKANEKQRSNKKAQGEPKAKNAALNIPQAKKPSPRGDLKVVIDFMDYPSVLKDVKTLAETKMRPLDLQIIYMVNIYLKKLPEGLLTLTPINNDYKNERE